MDTVTHKKTHPLLRAVAGMMLVVTLASFVVATNPQGARPFVTPVQAQAGLPFGGFSYFVFYCTCSGGIAVHFTDLTIPPMTGGLPLLFQPGISFLYPFGQIYRPGVWILGLWTPGSICLYFAGKGCSVWPTVGTMMFVGTSM
jgi:hypothetical protein